LVIVDYSKLGTIVICRPFNWARPNKEGGEKRKMKKLTILLVVIILVAGLLTGCDFLDWLSPKEKLITITWFEDAIRYNPDGTEYQEPWYNDPLGPATLIQDDGGWCFADISEYFNTIEIEFEGIVFIGETGKLSGNAAYTLYELPTENIFEGQVEIVIFEDGTSGTMIGTYTQFKYAFGTEEDILEHYSKAIECIDEGKWYVQYTNYIAYPR